jgi:uncharacterized protein YndB with AHSA1/START domain
MTKYEYVTIWKVKAPITSVWESIVHSELWPTWWKGSESVTELARGSENGIGNLRRYIWRGLLPYRLTFDIEVTYIAPHRVLEGKARGDLKGLGRWQFTPRLNETVVRYDWKICPNNRSLCILFPLARSLFEWNHNIVMRWGAEGLSHRLGVRVQRQLK